MKAKSINPTHFENIPTYVDGEKHHVYAIIETPRNQRHKYAFDAKMGAFAQTMTLAEGLQWPYDYGFIPQTLGDDGDPLDVLFLGDEPTFTGCLVRARPIGIVKIKKNGIENDRIIACPRKQKGITQHCDGYEDIGDLPEDTIASIRRYLVEYSESEGNDTACRGTESRKHAEKAIEKGRRLFKKS